MEHVKTWDEGPISEPWKTFATCRFQAELSTALQGFGFKAPTEIQARCWPLITSGRDVVGVAETGSGKTLAFLAPAFDWHVRMRNKFTPASRGAPSPVILVLAPTRELALQIEKVAEKLGETLGIHGCCLYGGADFSAQITTLRQQRPEVVVACPGRLLDLVQRKQLHLGSIGFLTLDEADRMLDLGFEEQVSGIIATLPRDRQTVMFTATWPEKVQSIANAYTRNPLHIQQVSGLACNSRVHQQIRLCKGQVDKIHVLVAFIRGLEPESRAIVFVNTKAVISDICQDLKRVGLSCVSLHAGLEQQERVKSLEAFRTGQCYLAVATDVASRGLDVRDVRAVVCFDVGRDKECHVHRVGRTGRAGASGQALTLIATSSQVDLRMAKEIFGFMREAGQTVSPALEVEVDALLCQEKGIVQDSNFVTPPDSSDEEADEEGPLVDELLWLPWNRRPFVLSSESEPRVTRRPVWSTVGRSEAPWSSCASDMGSVLSGTTYLQNPVEHLFGHAAARDISVKICQATVQFGCRLLTHDSDGQMGQHKPYRWMVLRRVPWSEISCASPAATEAGDAGLDFVWHIVVHELARTRAGKVRIATNYFKSNISMVYDYITDAFQLFDDDDPQMIQAAVSDESIVALLKLYFETGDTQNPLHFHTMAKINLWHAGTLLHHCCESGFARCVEYLLLHHSPQTAPEDKPWLQLADPIWLDKTYKNSAFHSTAWTGKADVMEVLCRWATDHQQEQKVRRLFDKKKQTPLDLVEVRLKKAEVRGQDTSCYKSTFNAIAHIFGRRPLVATSNQQSRSEIGQSLIFADREDRRRCIALPLGELTLLALVQALELEKEELGSKGVDTLLLSRADIKPLATEEMERSAAEKFMSLARFCRRVAFINCTASPTTAIHICRSVSRQLRQTLDGCDLAWESLAFPAWSEVPARGSQEFAEALLDLSSAIRETSCVQAIQSIQLAPGTTTGYLPSSERHLPQVLAATTLVKSMAWRLLGASREDWQETELWKRIGPSAEAFTSHNPLLKGPDTLERKLLDRGALSVAGNVSSCLSPGWKVFVEALADCLVDSSLTMLQWAPLVAGRAVEEDEQGLKVLREMADEALLYLLKMRHSRSRPGLNQLSSLVGPYLRGAGLEKCFPLATAYFRQKFKRCGVPGGHDRAGEATASIVPRPE